MDHESEIKMYTMVDLHVCTSIISAIKHTILDANSCIGAINLLFYGLMRFIFFKQKLCEAIKGI